MTEYIEREAVLRAISDYFHKTDPDGAEQFGVLKMHRLVRGYPAADVVPVVHGRWVFPTVIGGYGWDIPHCSVCNGVPCGTDENTKYCAICGARMDGE